MGAKQHLVVVVTGVAVVSAIVVVNGVAGKNVVAVVSRVLDARQLLVVVVSAVSGEK